MSTVILFDGLVFALRSWFSFLSLCPSSQLSLTITSKDYSKKHALGLQVSRLLNKLREYISRLVCTEEKCHSNWSSSSPSCPTFSASLLCWVRYLPGILSLLPFLNSTSLSHQVLSTNFIMVLQMFAVLPL